MRKIRNPKIILLVVLCFVIALITGYQGLFTRPHVRLASWITACSFLMAVLFSIRSAMRKRFTHFILVILLFGMATPLSSLVFGRLRFIYEVRQGERFFEQSFPAIEAYRAKRGHYPETFTFQCNDAPMTVQPLCRSGIISNEFVYMATSDGKTDSFVINFWPPPDCACQDKTAWVDRTYHSIFRKWHWSLVD
ncbi:hypothetical protein L0244_33680 [bacterium]|nr:hypothetical protein [bacterium]